MNCMVCSSFASAKVDFMELIMNSLVKLIGRAHTGGLLKNWSPKGAHTLPFRMERNWVFGCVFQYCICQGFQSLIWAFRFWAFSCWIAQQTTQDQAVEAVRKKKKKNIKMVNRRWNLFFFFRTPIPTLLSAACAWHCEHTSVIGLIQNTVSLYLMS